MGYLKRTFVFFDLQTTANRSNAGMRFQADNKIKARQPHQVTSDFNIELISFTKFYCSSQYKNAHSGEFSVIPKMLETSARQMTKKYVDDCVCEICIGESMNNHRP